MNINEMQAGRELDALVAEKVMGWHAQSWRDETDGGSCWRNSDGEAMAKHSVDSNPRWRWSPSTNIAAAWQVWKKLPRKSNLGFAISISLIDEEMSSEPDKRVYIVIATYHGATMCGGMADTPGLAICRAALKIVQENTE